MANYWLPLLEFRTPGSLYFWTK